MVPQPAAALQAEAYAEAVEDIAAWAVAHAAEASVVAADSMLFSTCTLFLLYI